MFPQRQSILPFKRYVSLSSGEKVEAKPTGDNPWRCEACNISVRTRQALEGHKTSKSHLMKVQKQEMKSGTAQPMLHFVSTGAENFDVYKYLPSVMANVVILGPLEQAKISSTVKKKKKLKGYDNRKGAATRKHIGPKRQLAVVMQLEENKRIGNPRKWADIAKDMGVPMGNLSKWWKHRDRIKETAEQMDAMQLLGMNSKRRSRNFRYKQKTTGHLSSLTEYMIYNIRMRSRRRQPVTILDAPERCVLCFGAIPERSGKIRTQLRTQLCSAERSP